MWLDPTRRAFLLRGLIISRYFFLPFPLYYFFPFFLFLFPEKRSRWRSSRRIRTRRMPCSTSSWVSHSCKGVSSNIFLNVSYENWTRFVTVIFLFKESIFLSRSRNGNWRNRRNFSKRIYWEGNVKGVLSMSLVQNYWNTLKWSLSSEKKKKKRQKIGRKICWLSFFN